MRRELAQSENPLQIKQLEIKAALNAAERERAAAERESAHMQ